MQYACMRAFMYVGMQVRMLTPMSTVDELFACRPARMEPNPGMKMLKIRQQIPVALGTEGT